MRRFWKRVYKEGPVHPKLGTHCWLWMGSTNNKGYGVLTVDGRSVGAHRYSWQEAFGDPGDLFVLHKCDEPACVNPNHLFIGTSSTNMKDCVSKGRHGGGNPRGRGQPKKTSPTTVRLYQELHNFVRTEAEQHRDGQSGVINDAVEFYKAHLDRKRRIVKEAV